MDTPIAHVDLSGRRAITTTGETLTYDVLVIATGARARRHPVLSSIAGVHHLRLEVGGVPFLEHQLSRLAAAGVAHVVVATSYRAELFYRHLKPIEGELELSYKGRDGKRFTDAIAEGRRLTGRRDATPASVRERGRGATRRALARSRRRRPHGCAGRERTTRSPPPHR